jgi:hypothetical protein
MLSDDDNRASRDYWFNAAVLLFPPPGKSYAASPGRITIFVCFPQTCAWVYGRSASLVDLSGRLHLEKTKLYGTPKVACRCADTRMAAIPNQDRRFLNYIPRTIGYKVTAVTFRVFYSGMVICGVAVMQQQSNSSSSSIIVVTFDWPPFSSWPS